jgi:ATP-dependent DNA helicase DinG
VAHEGRGEQLQSPCVPIDPTHILGPDGPIARRLGDRYERRPEQERMVSAVRDAMHDKACLVVEAGTGVGKSFAYLLPAIEAITSSTNKDERRRVIVSTHTIALQEQIIHKDVPLLQAVTPDEFSAVLVKGRGNYVSIRRANRAWDRKGALFEGDAELRSLRVIHDWVQTTDDGSLATLPPLDAMSVWSDVQSDGEDCLGRRCPTFNECFYQSARRRMQNTDLLVVNHALFFSDLALRAAGHGLLPPYDAVILDEAHTIEDVASEHFGLSVSRYQVSYLLSRLLHPRKEKGLLATLGRKIDSQLIDKALGAVSNCRYAADSFFDELVAWQEHDGRRNGRIDRPRIVDNVLSPQLQELSLILKLLRDKVDNDSDKLELNGYAGRAEAVAGAVKALLEQSLEDSVYWLEVSGDRYKRVKLCCSPIEVSGLLRERLFEAQTHRGEPLSVVLTSATLATSTRSDASGAFTHLKRRLGCESARELQLGSPFDYANQAELILDVDLPEPGAPGHFDKFAPRLLAHLDETDGGAFVLFTSYALLKQAAQWLRPRLAERGMPLHVHGEGEQRSVLLDRFKGDRRSVLLGADSFWQGVDVPGEGLRSVIITRLPFEVPDRPLIEARMQRITARGGNAFAEYSLPGALLKFKQGFGRLIRSKLDRGRVVVMDSRMATKGYGRRFLAALPAVKVVRRGGGEAGAMAVKTTTPGHTTGG